MRAFFCIPIEREICEQIGRIASRLRDMTDMRASWVAQANYHVTVRFLGDIEPGWIPDLERIARAACAGIKPTDGIANQVGAFPKLENARVLWVGGEAPDSLRQLVVSLEQGLGALGFPKQRADRGFHITLARIKGRPDPLLPHAVDATRSLTPFRVSIGDLALMRSTLTSHGAQYTPLFSHPLGGGTCEKV